MIVLVAIAVVAFVLVQGGGLKRTTQVQRNQAQQLSTAAGDPTRARIVVAGAASFEGVVKAAMYAVDGAQGVTIWTLWNSGVVPSLPAKYAGLATRGDGGTVVVDGSRVSERAIADALVTQGVAVSGVTTVDGVVIA